MPWQCESCTPRRALRHPLPGTVAGTRTEPSQPKSQKSWQCHRPAQQCSASAGPTALPSTSTHGQCGKLSKSDTTGRFFCLGTSNTREEPNSQRPSEQAKAHTIQLSRTASSCYSTFPLPTFSTQPLTFCPFPPCCLLYSFSFLRYQLLLMGPLLLSSS